MGGIFGKNKRVCVFPKRVVLYKAKGKRASRTTRMFCDASTWTGENHFHSARIGRTPKSPEHPAPKLPLDTPESESAPQARQGMGEQTASLNTQHTKALLSVPAGDAQDGEILQDPEAKPNIEVMQHQELAEQTKEAARRSPQESSKAEAVLSPAGSCVSSKQLGHKHHEMTPLTKTVVRAEIHVSAGVQGGPGKVQSAIVDAELLAGAELEDGVVCGSEEPSMGRTPQGVAAESSALASTPEEAELPLETAETRDGIAGVERCAEEGEVCCAAEAPPDLQLEQNTEVPIPEGEEENPLEAAQAEEVAEAGEDVLASKEILCCLAELQVVLQDKEEIKASKGENQRSTERAQEI